MSEHVSTDLRAAPTVPDAKPDNWVHRLAPTVVRPYLRLARLDRPIGMWLLLFPCWWGQALGQTAAGDRWLNVWFLLLFMIGALVMRGAGCTYNDIVDRKYDAGVARTRGRPIPSGEVTVRQAVAFMVLQCLIGLAVLLQFNWPTVWLGIASLALVAVYPFMKRYTYWPQVVLGLTFKWGALVGWSAIRGQVEWPAVVLYAGSILWTVAYDTIYAHQDKEDDLSLGLKSTAIRFGETTQAWLWGLYTGALALWSVAAWMAGAGVFTGVGLVVAAAFFVWQITTLDMDNPENCITRFRSNRFVGWLFVAGIALDMATGATGM
ncbi:MAG: 4-hydroxybenzoate octaprenyltransferase [Hyphomicrobiaceae bacterium]